MYTPNDFVAAAARLQKIADDLGYGDVFNYNRCREILQAIELGFDISPTLSGADAYSKDGKPKEFKSTVQSNLKGTYAGISVKDEWHKVEDYLINEKIGPYDQHYFARFEGTEIVELWVMDADDVLAVILPKCKKSYLNRSNKADSRIRAEITQREIYSLGTKIK